MTTWFVSRHPGAREWAHRQSIPLDRQITHLDIQEIRPGDTVIGSLPVHLAAQVCARGARYLHLVLDLPPELRGRELDAEQMQQCGARIAAYHVAREKNHD